ncbi:MAG: ABC transporter permease [Chlamydiia bacterium]|nr:ABC transporter permease [Chlamydiia bacterium]
MLKSLIQGAMMSSWTAYFHLIRKDLVSFMREFRTKFIDTFFLFFTNVMAFGYFLQQEGAHEGYAAFFVVGAIASFGFIEIVGKVSVLLADICGDKTINHTLVMPIRSNMVFYYIASSWAITSMILSVLLFPIGKLLVFTEWHWEAISFWRVALMFVTANIFFGCFALWLSSVISGLTNLNSLWLRYIAPMWMFGGYVYSWQSAYQLSHLVGYLSLINPMIYVMEGMRAAALGQEGYLPFWFSFCMLWIFIVVCTMHATRRLRRKLDCI